MARDVHLYLSLIPEALIASMLTPEEFGVYYAVGTSKKAHGQAIFFEVDADFRQDYFRIDEGIRRCVPHEDGSPKASIYISVYRVLEHVALRTGHLRQCLMALATKSVAAKMVNRTEPAAFHYRAIKSGFFVGNEASLRHFPMPSPENLRSENYRWWRSAEMACRERR